MAVLDDYNPEKIKDLLEHMDSLEGEESVREVIFSMIQIKIKNNVEEIRNPFSEEESISLGGAIQKYVYKKLEKYSLNRVRINELLSEYEMFNDENAISNLYSNNPILYLENFLTLALGEYDLDFSGFLYSIIYDDLGFGEKFGKPKWGEDLARKQQKINEEIEGEISGRIRDKRG